jgi:hypothetical protein
MSIQYVMQIQALMEKLEGATALNIYLINRLGGQVTIDKDEMARVLKDFNNMNYSVNEDEIVIKLSSAPLRQDKEAA